MLLLSVAEDQLAAFEADAAAALASLCTRAGYRGSRLARSLDDPGTWVMITDWAGVGDYRRALGSTEVRLATASLLARAMPLPGAFEVLRSDGPDGVSSLPSDRSASAGTGSLHAHPPTASRMET